MTSGSCRPAAAAWIASVAEQTLCGTFQLRRTLPAARPARESMAGPVAPTMIDSYTSHVQGGEPG